MLSESELVERKKMAPVFKFGLFTFTKSEPNENGIAKLHSTCSQCDKSYTHDNRANTTTLKSHFYRQHTEVLIAQGEQAQKDISDGKEKFENSILATDLLGKVNGFQLPLINLVPRTPMSVVKPASAKLSGVSKKKTRSKKKKRDARIFQEKFIRMLVANKISFKSCDEPTTVDFVNYASFGNENVVSYSQIEKNIVNLYGEQFQVLKKELGKHEGRFALGVEELQSNNGQKVLKLTLNSFNDSFELEKNVIGFEVFDAKDADLLGDRVSNLLKDLDVEDRIVSITRENLGPANSLLKKSEENKSNKAETKGDVRCASQLLSLSAESLLKYAFFKTEESRTFTTSIREIDEKFPNLRDFSIRIKSLPNIIRSIVKAIRRSTLLESIFTSSAGKGKLASGENTLVLDNETETETEAGWISTFKMIEQFLHHREEIDALLEQVRSLDQQVRVLDQKEIDLLGLDVLEISDLEWDYLSTLSDALQIYYDPMIVLKASTEPTINWTIPHVHSLLKNLEALNSDTLKASNPYLAQGLHEAYVKLYPYYPINEIKGEEILDIYLATVLDPRFKLQYFIKRGFSTELIARIKEYFYAVFYRYKAEHVDINKKKKSSSPPESKKQAKPETPSEHSNVSKDFFSDEEVSDNDENEVTTYLYEKRERRATSVVDFYQTQKQSFPVLYRMAKDFLAIPATSVSSGSSISMANYAISTSSQNPAALTKMLAFLESRGVFLNSNEFHAASKQSNDDFDVEMIEDSDEEDEDMDEVRDEVRDEVMEKVSTEQPDEISEKDLEKDQKEDQKEDQKDVQKEDQKEDQKGDQKEDQKEDQKADSKSDLEKVKDEHDDEDMDEDTENGSTEKS